MSARVLKGPGIVAALAMACTGLVSVRTVPGVEAAGTGPQSGTLNAAVPIRRAPLTPIRVDWVARIALEPEMQIGVYRNTFPEGASTYLAALRDGGGPGTTAAGLQIVHWYALWGGWKSELDPGELAVVSAVGATPLITWEPWAGRPLDPEWSLAASVLNGAHDDYIRRWARTLREFGDPVMLRFAHEMHHQSYPWAEGVNGNTAADYRAAWRRVHDIFAAEGTDNVLWVWNPNTMAGTPTDTYRAIYASLYPGDDFVDWVGLDIYNGGDEVPAWGGWRSFAEATDAPYAALTSITDKPIIIPELGSAEAGGSKADWIRDASTQISEGRYGSLRAVVWFDVDKEARWSTSSSPQAQEAWNASVRLLTDTGFRVIRP